MKKKKERGEKRGETKHPARPLQPHEVDPKERTEVTKRNRTKPNQKGADVPYY